MNARKLPVRGSSVKKKKTKSGVSSGKKSKKTTLKTPHVVTRKKDYSKNVKHVPVVDSTPGDSKVLILRNTMNVALSSPFRYPIDYGNVVAQTARLSGVFFVIAGALFTFIHINAINSIYSTASSLSQSAQTISSTDCIGTICSTSTSDTSGSSDSTNYSDSSSGTSSSVETTSTSYSTLDQATTDTKPNVELTILKPLQDAGTVIERSDGTYTVQGVVDVVAHVERANSIEVYIKNSSGNRIKIGNMTMLTIGEWKFHWDSKTRQDGYYNLYAYVSNNYGKYEDGQTDIEIKNTSAITETQITDTTMSTDGTSTTSSYLTFTPDAKFTFDATEPLKDEARALIDTKDAEKVSFYIDGNKIGAATQIDDLRWRFAFDTRKQLNGTHYAFVRVTYDNGFEFTSTRKYFTIYNTSSLLTTTTLTSDGEILDTSLRPDIDVDIRESSPLSELVDVRIESEDAQFVELYVTPKYSLSEQFVGLGTKVEPGKFSYVWNTRNTPNGEYQFFAKVKNQYGYYSSIKQSVSIKNEALVTNTESKETIVTETKLLTEKIESLYETNELELKATETVVTETGAIEIEKEIEDQTKILLESFRADIEEEISRLISALRSGDEIAIKRAKDRIEELRLRIVRSDLESKDAEDLRERLDKELGNIFEDLLSRTEKTEILVKERIGEAILKDSDSDGVLDYDEINIYKTDPFSADTDSDGFIDGAEILNGYDPLDTKPEILVTYESPKETGVVREDLLVISSIETALKEEIEATKPVAVIKGKALPNSFVTLYIFSTPIVVTVKTADDGSWSYTFDKELENGEHEVYVGITDNAGKIVAKSNPLTFVKTAEAFTPVDASVSGGVLTQDLEESQSFLSEYAILLILSISVVALGLVLMLLGIHMSPRRSEELVLQ